MKHRLTALALHAGVLLALAATMPTLLAQARADRARPATGDRRDRGSVSLEQAILTAVLSAAAIAFGVAVVAAIVSHQNQIK